MNILVNKTKSHMCPEITFNHYIDLQISFAAPAFIVSRNHRNVIMPDSNICSVFVIYSVPAFRLSVSNPTGTVPSCLMIYCPSEKDQPRLVGRLGNLISLCIVTKANQEIVLIYLLIFACYLNTKYV